jgi:hypothetical protein
MLAAMKLKHPELLRQKLALDDNAIDALWLYKWAEKFLARIPR